MKILLISPLGFPINENTKYAGIEKLVVQYSFELAKNHEVTVVAHGDSDFAFTEHIKYTPHKGEDIFVQSESMAYELYRKRLREFDVIHDFSHSHWASRNNNNLPSLNIFWHAPQVALFPKAPYNIIALSEWAKTEFKKYYRQDAVYVDSIMIDPDIYKPGDKPRTNRFLTIGIMAEHKGNLEAVMLCKEAGVPLDVCGADSDAGYKELVIKMCDNKIKFHGLISHDKKIELMQTCKGLLYFNSEPEVTSHKVQEVMMCGAPVITTKLGALPEIVTNRRDGYCCGNIREALSYIKIISEIKQDYNKLKARYSPEAVIKRYEPIYEEVADGRRW